MPLREIIASDRTQPAQYLENLQTYLQQLQAEANAIINAQRTDYQKHQLLMERLELRIEDVRQEEEKLERNTEYQTMIKSKQDLKSQIRELQQDADTRKHARIPDKQAQLTPLQEKIDDKEKEINIKQQKRKELEEEIDNLETGHNQAASRYIILHLEQELIEGFIISLERFGTDYWNRVITNINSKITNLERCNSIKELEFYTNLYPSEKIGHLLEALQHGPVKHLGPIPYGLGLFDETNSIAEDAPISAYLGEQRTPSPPQSRTPSEWRPITPRTPTTPVPILRPTSAPILTRPDSERSKSVPVGRSRRKLANEDRRNSERGDSDRRDSRGSRDSNSPQ